MSKNITIGILGLVVVFFILFANIKANEAEKYAIQSELNLKLAEENEAKARAQEKAATEMAAKALIAERKAEELKLQLDDCN